MDGRSGAGERGGEWMEMIRNVVSLRDGSNQLKRSADSILVSMVYASYSVLLVSHFVFVISDQRLFIETLPFCLEHS